MVGNWCHGIGNAEFPLPHPLPNAPLSYEAAVKSKETGITRNFKLKQNFQGKKKKMLMQLELDDANMKFQQLAMSRRLAN